MRRFGEGWWRVLLRFVDVGRRFRQKGLEKSPPSSGRRALAVPLAFAVSVLLGVMLCRFVVMVLCVKMVSVRDMRVMSG